MTILTTHIKETIEMLDELFSFDGITYKGNRHWRDDVKQNLIKSFITSREEALVKKIVGHIMILTTESPEHESDEYDEGRRDMKMEIINLLK